MKMTMLCNECSQKIREIFEKLSSFSINRIGCEDDLESIEHFREQARSIVSFFPFRILGMVHPEWINRRLTAFCEDELASIRYWIEREIPDLVSMIHIEMIQPFPVIRQPDRGIIMKLIDGWPIMSERLRFEDFSWKDLPLLSWRKVQDLDSMCKRLDTDLQLALFYKPDFMKLNESERKQSLEWLRFKMHPDRWVPFKHILENKEQIQHRSVNRKSLVILQQLRKGFEFNERF